jgi:hypothetical protein
MRLSFLLALSVLLAPVTLLGQATSQPQRIAISGIAISGKTGTASVSGIVQGIPLENAKNAQIQLGGGNPAQRGGRGNPEQQRLKLLQQLTIDRSPSGILQARIEASRPPEPAPKPPVPPKPDGPAPELNEAQKEALRKREELQAKVEEFKAAVNTFRLDVTLGNWDEVRAYLEALPDPAAQQVFTRILAQLGGKANVAPRPELAAMGAKPTQQNHYLRPEEILALSEASKTAPDRNMLLQLAGLLDSSNPPPANFFALLKSGTRYFGTQDLDARLRSAEFLLNAGLLKEATAYLPEAATARTEKNTAALNLLARYHTEAHKVDDGKEHLPAAW